MKINIFDRYNENTKKLINSLNTAGVNRKNLFVHYDGELPVGALSPYTFFTKINVEDENCEGLFFDQVKVPDLYDIRHTNGENAEIRYLENTVGKIHYRKQGFRLVDWVDWLAKENSNSIIKRDYYNLAGNHYASTYYSAQGPYQTEYYNLDGEAIVTEDLVRRSVQLKHQSQIHHFENETKFFLYFLKIAKIKPSDIYINSLSYPLFISRALNIGKHTTLFWQEPINKDIPGNMQNELKTEKVLKQIVFENVKHLDLVKERFPKTTVKLSYLSPIGVFVRENKYRHNAFILTNSDNIYGLQEVLTDFPDLNITVAAYTNMSDKLLHLEAEYENIELIPSINDERLKEELEKADIYLDINRGLKVGDILKKAYEQNMIIFSYKEVAIKESPSFIFEEVRDLSNHLSYILTDRMNWQHLLKKMVEKNGPLSTVADYQSSLDL